MHWISSKDLNTFFTPWLFRCWTTLLTKKSVLRSCLWFYYIYYIYYRKLESSDEKLIVVFKRNSFLPLDLYPLTATFLFFHYICCDFGPLLHLKTMPNHCRMRPTPSAQSYMSTVGYKDACLPIEVGELRQIDDLLRTMGLSGRSSCRQR